MSVSNGQPGNATTFNGAFLSRLTDSDTIAVVGLNDPDTASGTGITNSQKEHNSISSFVGKSVNTAKDAVPTWASNTIGTTNDPVKTRVESIQTVVESNSVTLSSLSPEVVSLRTLSGTSTSANNLGTFLGTVISDNATIKSALQELETFTQSGGGSGTGAKNYIANPTAEVDTSGWATYADAAAATPVDGTGGSPTVTFTRSTTTPLSGTADFNFTKDAANRQGQGASYDFSIDNADLANVMGISFDYEIVSGTYSGGTSSTDSDVEVYIYDVTNSQLIQPSQFKLDGAVVGTKYHFRGQFQTNYNSNSYRLILHTATTSASAFVLAMDNFLLGPQTKSVGSIITEWLAFTPSLTWTTNTTNTGMWRRSGDSFEAIVKSVFSGQPGGGGAVMTLPFGLNIDTTKIVSTNGRSSIGAGIFDDNSGSAYLCTVTYTSATTVSVRFTDDAAAGVITGTINNTTPVTIASSDENNFWIRVPILGWGSNVLISNDADTRVTAFKVDGGTLSGTIGTTFAGSGAITWSAAAIFDTHGGWNGTTTYTIPTSGYYQVNAQVRFNSTEATNDTVDLAIAVNGVEKHTQEGRIQNSGLSTDPFTVIGVVKCNSGDAITIRLYTNSNTPTFSANQLVNSFGVHKLSGPAQIAASEIIAAIAGGDPASATSGNPIIFPTVVADTHGAYNSTTGQFTAPAAGFYRMHGYIQSATAAVQLRVYVNGSLIKRVGYTDSNGEATYTGTVKLLAGDTTSLRPDATLDAQSESTFHVERLGGIG